jgi:hypothetical protein
VTELVRLLAGSSIQFRYLIDIVLSYGFGNRMGSKGRITVGEVGRTGVGRHSVHQEPTA